MRGVVNVSATQRGTLNALTHCPTSAFRSNTSAATPQPPPEPPRPATALPLPPLLQAVAAGLTSHKLRVLWLLRLLRLFRLAHVLRQLHKWVGPGGLGWLGHGGCLGMTAVCVAGCSAAGRVARTLM